MTKLTEDIARCFDCNSDGFCDLHQSQIDSENDDLRKKLRSLEDRIGDTATDLFEQMLKGNWKDDHGHDISLNYKMVELQQIVTDILQQRGVVAQ